jgi:hypothetical protein
MTEADEPNLFNFCVQSCGRTAPLLVGTRVAQMLSPPAEMNIQTYTALSVA